MGGGSRDDIELCLPIESSRSSKSPHTVSPSALSNSTNNHAGLPLELIILLGRRMIGFALVP